MKVLNEVETVIFGRLENAGLGLVSAVAKSVYCDLSRDRREEALTYLLGVQDTLHATGHPMKYRVSELRDQLKIIVRRPRI